MKPDYNWCFRPMSILLKCSPSLIGISQTAASLPIDSWEWLIDSDVTCSSDIGLLSLEACTSVEQAAGDSMCDWSGSVSMHSSRTSSFFKIPSEAGSVEEESADVWNESDRTSRLFSPVFNSCWQGVASDSDLLWVESGIVWSCLLSMHDLYFVTPRTFGKQMIARNQW